MAKNTSNITKKTKQPSAFNLASPLKPRKLIDFKFGLPHNWTQIKTTESVVQNSKASAKSLTEFRKGVAPSPVEELPQKKFRKVPFSAKQRAAHKNFVISIKIKERQLAKDKEECLQQRKEKNRKVQEDNKLAICKTCGAVVHRYSAHTATQCKHNLERKIKSKEHIWCFHAHDT